MERTGIHNLRKAFVSFDKHTVLNNGDCISTLKLKKVKEMKDPSGTATKARVKTATIQNRRMNEQFPGLQPGSMVDPGFSRWGGQEQFPGQQPGSMVDPGFSRWGGEEGARRPDYENDDSSEWPAYDQYDHDTLLTPIGEEGQTFYPEGGSQFPVPCQYPQQPSQRPPYNSRDKRDANWGSNDWSNSWSSGSQGGTFNDRSSSQGGSWGHSGSGREGGSFNDRGAGGSWGHGGSGREGGSFNDRGTGSSWSRGGSGREGGSFNDRGTGGSWSHGGSGREGGSFNDRGSGSSWGHGGSGREGGTFNDWGSGSSWTQDGSGREGGSFNDRDGSWGSQGGTFNGGNAWDFNGQSNTQRQPYDTGYRRQTDDRRQDYGYQDRRWKRETAPTSRPGYDSAAIASLAPPLQDKVWIEIDAEDTCLNLMTSYDLEIVSQQGRVIGNVKNLTLLPVDLQSGFQMPKIDAVISETMGGRQSFIPHKCLGLYAHAIDNKQRQQQMELKWFQDEYEKLEGRTTARPRRPGASATSRPSYRTARPADTQGLPSQGLDKKQMLLKLGCVCQMSDFIRVNVSDAHLNSHYVNVSGFYEFSGETYGAKPFYTHKVSPTLTYFMYYYEPQSTWYIDDNLGDSNPKLAMDTERVFVNCPADMSILRGRPPTWSYVKNLVWHQVNNIQVRCGVW